MSNRFVYHYVPGTGKDIDDAVNIENVLAPIKRQKVKPVVTAVPNIRSRFCFDFSDDNKVRTRELSCHCDQCLHRKFRKCASHKGWKTTSMTYESGSTLASTSNTKSVEEKLSRLRRAEARQVNAGEIVALQSEDDSEGISFWFAEAVTVVPHEKPCFCYQGNPKKIDGVEEFKRGNYYITLQSIDRFPADSETMFRQNTRDTPWTVHAEGVALRNVGLDSVVGRTRARTRSGKQPVPQYAMFELPAAELERCTEAGEERIDASGKQKHLEPDQPERLLRRLD